MRVQNSPARGPRGRHALLPVALLALVPAVLSMAGRREVWAEDSGRGYGSGFRYPVAVPALRESLAAVELRQRAGGPSLPPAEGVDRGTVAVPDTTDPEREYPVTAASGSRPTVKVTLPPNAEFDTLGFTNTVVPDGAIAAGPAHLVTAVNSSFKVQNLQGGGISTTTLASFFPNEPTQSLFNPRLAYDATAATGVNPGRFLLAAVGFKSSPATSSLVLAVSQSDNPTGNWNKYVLNVARGNPVTHFAADCSIGYDSQAVYVAMNMQPFTTGSAGNRVVILDKAKLLSGAAVVPVILDDVTEPGPPAGVVASGLKPAETVGATAATAPGIMVSRAGSTALALYKINDPLAKLGAPTVTSSRLSVAAAVQAGDAAQKGDPALLKVPDPSLQKTTVRNGILWTAQTASSTGSAGGRAQVNFYKIDTAGTGIVLDAESIVDAAIAFFCPAIVPDVFGNAVAVFAGSSANLFPSIYFARYDTAAGGFEAPVQLREGATPYVNPDAQNRNRWGDYFDAAIDPSSGDSQVWIHGELSVTKTTWKMRAARVAASGLIVMAPNGGENFGTKTTRQITWTPFGLSGNVKIEVSRDGGQNWSTITANAPNTGTYDWLVTGPATFTARVRITSLAVPQVSDTSDRDFTILASISGRVTSLAGGFGGVTVSIGNFSAVTAPDGTYTIVNVPAGTYRVTPSLTGYSFNPTFQSVTLGDDATGVDFTISPGVPTKLVATPRSQTEIDLSWQVNSINERGFEIERRSGGGSFQPIFTTAPGAQSYSDTGLTPGTTYTYRVRAKSDIGDSAYSNDASATTFPLPPTAPTTLQAGPVNGTSVHLTWTDTSGSEDSFEVERSPGTGGNFTRVAVLGTNATQFDDSGLAPDTQYTYQVRAVNAGGASGYSNTVTITTGPRAPSGLTGTVLSQTAVRLVWTDNSSNENGFLVERKSGSGNFQQIGATTPNQATFTDPNAAAATTYVYRVRAIGAGGAFSDYSGEVTVTTLPNRPLPPTELAAVARSPFRVDLTWKDGSTNETGFKIERKSGDQDFAQIDVAAADATSYSDGTLAPETEYVYRVRATNTGGDSDFTDEVKVTTLPPAPASVSATAISNQEIRVRWSDNSQRETGFVIERKLGGPDVPNAFVPVQTVGPDVTTYVDFGLQVRTTYTYRVRATSAAGESLDSNVATATTLSDPPQAPSGLIATVVSPTRIDLRWDDNSTDETGFQIERVAGDGQGEFTTLTVVGVDVNAYIDLSVQPSSTYTYRVRSLSLNGVSHPTNAVTVTTLPESPEAPSDLTVRRVDSGIRLAWEDQSATETGFKIERRTGSSGFREVATVPADTERFTDTTVEPGIHYTYRVRATNRSGDSDYSNEASVSTLREFRVHGRVTVGRRPLAGVRITAGGAHAVTDADGFYELTGLVADRYEVRAHKLGYVFAPRSRSIRVGPDRSGVDFQARATGVLSRVDLTPSVVIGGRTVKGTVVFSRPLAEAVQVQIASSNSGVASPNTRTVTVPAGARSASFSISTRRVSGAQVQVFITAAADGVGRLAQLSVNP